MQIALLSSLCILNTPAAACQGMCTGPADNAIPAWPRSEHARWLADEVPVQCKMPEVLSFVVLLKHVHVLRSGPAGLLLQGRLHLHQRQQLVVGAKCYSSI